MLYDKIIKTDDLYIQSVHVMLMDGGDFAEYLYKRFPYELNDLTDLKYLYSSLILEIAHMRMPLKATSSRCLVLNALCAYYPSKIREEITVVEFRSIQKPYEIEPDIRCAKKILLNLIGEKWGVRFKGKQLISW